MVNVWDHSKHRGTRLLLMLALADSCNDEDIAWPKVRTLAQRIRSSERQARTTLRTLEDSGELWTHFQTGRAYPNFYLVAVRMTASTIAKKLETFLFYPPELADEIGQLLVAGQQGEEIRTGIDALLEHQPFASFLVVRRTIMASRRDSEKGKEPSPPKERKRGKEPAPRPEGIAVKGEVTLPHEPMNPLREGEEEEKGINKNELTAALIRFFSEEAGIAEPSFKGGQASTSNIKWQQPLRRIAEACYWDKARTQRVILYALSVADRENWGSRVRTPGSIEGECTGIIGELKRKARRERAEAQRQATRASAPVPVLKTYPPEVQAARGIWGQALGELQLQMTTETYNTWLKPTEAVKQDNGTLHVEVENEYVKEWLTNRLGSTVLRAVKAIAPDVSAVKFYEKE